LKQLVQRNSAHASRQIGASLSLDATFES